jgi:hypothetical protein
MIWALLNISDWTYPRPLRWGEAIINRELANARLHHHSLRIPRHRSPDAGAKSRDRSKEPIRNGHIIHWEFEIRLFNGHHKVGHNFHRKVNRNLCLKRWYGIKPSQ